MSVVFEGCSELSRCFRPVEPDGELFDRRSRCVAVSCWSRWVEPNGNQLRRSMESGIMFMESDCTLIGIQFRHRAELMLRDFRRARPDGINN